MLPLVLGLGAMAGLRSDAWSRPARVDAQGTNKLPQYPPRWSAPDTGGMIVVLCRQRIGRAGWGSGSASDTIPMSVVLPLADDRQTPVGLELHCEPSSALLGAKLVGTGAIPVLEVQIDRPALQQVVQLSWSALVMTRPMRVTAVPAKVPLPLEVGPDAAPWLRSSACAQCEDEQIQRHAREIRGSGLDEWAVIRRTIIRAMSIRSRQKGRASGFDAVEALERSGSCLSNANLMAALLRANGIPARIVSGVPTWGGPLSVHFIVEAYVPGFGWYPIESTRGIAPWPAREQVRLAIVSPADEDRGQRRANGDGASCLPYLACEEMPASTYGVRAIGTLDARTGASRVAMELASGMSSKSEAERDLEFERARMDWTEWLRSGAAWPTGATVRSPHTLDDLREKYGIVDTLFTRYGR